MDALPVSPVRLELPKAVEPRLAPTGIQLGAPPQEPLDMDDDDQDDEVLELGEDSDPIGFEALGAEIEDDEPTAAPRTLRVRVVPAAGGQQDAPDVVVPLSSQAVDEVDAAMPGPLERGSVFAGRYRIDEPIETLGSCHSFLAIQEPMVRRVRLMVFEVLEDEQLRTEIEDRFLREASLLARWGHPNLAAVVDFGRAPDGRCYVATEVLYGFELAELLRRGPLPQDRLVPLALDVARGLAACHDAGVVHRALWAGHVTLQTGAGMAPSDSMARLGSYGLGMAVELLDDPPPLALARSLAPEVVQGDDPGPVSDVYAFGALLYQAIVGQPLFEGDADQVLRAQVEVEPTELQSVIDAGGRTGELARIASRCLSKDPVDRYAHAAELVPEIEILARGLQRGAVATPRLSWRVLFAAALSGALLPTLLLAAAGVWVLTRPPAPPVEPVIQAPDLSELVTVQANTEVLNEVENLRKELAALEDALAEVELAAEEQEEEPEPPPRRVRVFSAPPVAPAPPPEPEPEPDREAIAEAVAAALAEAQAAQAAAEPEPEPEPPPPLPHAAAASLDGLWLGKAGTSDLALDLTVAHDGVISGSARIKRGGSVESASVRGVVGQSDGAWTVELQATLDGETVSFSGRLEGSGIQGRMASGGRTKGRWKVAR